MLKKIEDTLHKSCLIGLTYFDIDGNELKRQMLAGTVTAVDEEMGITLSLLSADKNQGDSKEAAKAEKAANFIIPSNLSCWFNAPKGEYHTSHGEVKIVNPDYLVTWDIYQTKSQDNDKKEGEQQWWKWYPRTEDPSVNA